MARDILGIIRKYLSIDDILRLSITCKSQRGLLPNYPDLVYSREIGKHIGELFSSKKYYLVLNSQTEVPMLRCTVRIFVDEWNRRGSISMKFTDQWIICRGERKLILGLPLELTPLKIESRKIDFDIVGSRHKKTDIREIANFTITLKKHQVIISRTDKEPIRGRLMIDHFGILFISFWLFHHDRLSKKYPRGF